MHTALLYYKINTVNLKQTKIIRGPHSDCNVFQMCCECVLSQVAPKNRGPADYVLLWCSKPQWNAAVEEKKSEAPNHESLVFSETNHCVIESMKLLDFHRAILSDSLKHFYTVEVLILQLLSACNKTTANVWRLLIQAWIKDGPWREVHHINSPTTWILGHLKFVCRSVALQWSGWVDIL